MPFQPAPDCAKVEINYTASGVPIANIVNFRFPTGYTQTDLENLAIAVDNWVSDFVLALIRSTVTYDNVVVTGLESANDLQATDDASSAAGALSGGALPNNVTLCLSLRTGFTGRSARGRFFAPPYDATKLASVNQVTSTFRDQWLTALAQLAVDALAEGAIMVVLQRFSGGSPLATAVARTVTSFLSVNDRTDSQRGRLPEE